MDNIQHQFFCVDNIQKDASGALAPFSKQGPVMSNTCMQVTGILYPIATCLVVLPGREALMSKEHLKQDMPMRYVVRNFLCSGSRIHNH